MIKRNFFPVLKTGITHKTRNRLILNGLDIGITFAILVSRMEAKHGQDDL
jgi:hypothetical protein